VSVSTATALDASSTFLFSPPPVPEHDFNSYFSYPDASGSDSQFFEDGLLPLANTLNLELADLAAHGPSFDLSSYLDEPDSESFDPSPFQLADEHADKTAGLQPSFGASSHGCDDERNAVGV